MPFPSVLSTFSRPTASNRLDNPSHSALHNTVSSALGQVEAVIGTSSSIIGTIIGDLRNPQSNGGGHVQTANKGGTGQTSYTKGDILVAQSQSVLAKLAVGADSQVLTVNSSMAIGVSWSNAGGTKLANSASVQTIMGNDTPTAVQSILSISVPGSILGTNNAIRTTVFLREYTRGGGSPSVLFRATYGNNTVASILWREPAAPLSSLYGQINFNLLANGATNSQRGVLTTPITPYIPTPGGVIPNSIIGYLYNSNTSSVNSAANQTLGINVQMQTGALTIDGYEVEKIT